MSEYNAKNYTEQPVRTYPPLSKSRLASVGASQVEAKFQY